MFSTKFYKVIPGVLHKDFYKITSMVSGFTQNPHSLLLLQLII